MERVSLSAYRIVACCPPINNPLHTRVPEVTKKNDVLRLEYDGTLLVLPLVLEYSAEYYVMVLSSCILLFFNELIIYQQAHIKR